MHKGVFRILGNKECLVISGKVHYNLAGITSFISFCSAPPFFTLLLSYIFQLPSLPDPFKQQHKLHHNHLDGTLSSCHTLKHKAATCVNTWKIS
jgi:hypothetical protein